MNNLLGFVGFASSGKDTVASFLIDDFGYTPIAFADSIKDCLSSIFSWDRQLIEGATPESRKWRETVDPWWAAKLGVPNFTPRWAMTHFGTDVMRAHFDPRIWILNTERRLMSHQNKRIVVKDCRFPNEVATLRANGGKICRVRRGPEPAWYGIAKQANEGCPVARATMQRFDIHESEWAWIGVEIDHMIENDSTVADLGQKIGNIVAAVEC